jgi:hypothetical protein
MNNVFDELVTPETEIRDIVLKVELLDSYDTPRFFAVTWDTEIYKIYEFDECWKLVRTLWEEKEKNWIVVMDQLRKMIEEACL